MEGLLPPCIKVPDSGAGVVANLAPAPGDTSTSSPGSWDSTLLSPGVPFVYNPLPVIH